MENTVSPNSLPTGSLRGPLIRKFGFIYLPCKGEIQASPQSQTCYLYLIPAPHTQNISLTPEAWGTWVCFEYKISALPSGGLPINAQSRFFVFFVQYVKGTLKSFPQSFAILSHGTRGNTGSRVVFKFHYFARLFGRMALRLDDVEETAELCPNTNAHILLKVATSNITKYSHFDEFFKETDAEIHGLDVL